VEHNPTVLLNKKKQQLKQGLGSGSGFSDFVDLDPYWESGSRLQIQAQKLSGKMLFLGIFLIFTTERHKIELI
jgi:hypothetical protein